MSDLSRCPPWGAGAKRRGGGAEHCEFCAGGMKMGENAPQEKNAVERFYAKHPVITWILAILSIIATIATISGVAIQVYDHVQEKPTMAETISNTSFTQDTTTAEPTEIPTTTTTTTTTTVTESPSFRTTQSLLTDPEIFENPDPILYATTIPDDIAPMYAEYVPVNGIAFNGSHFYEIARGRTCTLFWIITPWNATNKNVVFLSSNAAVATVSPTGVVTAKGQGNCTITIKTTDPQAYTYFEDSIDLVVIS